MKALLGPYQTSTKPEGGTSIPDSAKKGINQFCLPHCDKCLEFSFGAVPGPAHISPSQKGKYNAINQYKTPWRGKENFRERTAGLKEIEENDTKLSLQKGARPQILCVCVTLLIRGRVGITSQASCFMDHRAQCNSVWLEWIQSEYVGCTVSHKFICWNPNL